MRACHTSYNSLTPRRRRHVRHRTAPGWCPMGPQSWRGRTTRAWHCGCPPAPLPQHSTGSRWRARAAAPPSAPTLRVGVWRGGEWRGVVFGMRARSHRAGAPAPTQTRTCGHREGGRHGDAVRTAGGGQRAVHLWEAHVVAGGEPQRAHRRVGHRHHGVARHRGRRFSQRHARQLHVKQVNLRGVWVGGGGGALNDVALMDAATKARQQRTLRYAATMAPAGDTTTCVLYARGGVGGGALPSTASPTPPELARLPTPTLTPAGASWKPTRLNHRRWRAARAQYDAMAGPSSGSAMAAPSPAADPIKWNASGRNSMAAPLAAARAAWQRWWWCGFGTGAGV